jgi:hypothetical protein
MIRRLPFVLLFLTMAGCPFLKGAFSKQFVPADARSLTLTAASGGTYCTMGDDPVTAVATMADGSSYTDPSLWQSLDVTATAGSVGSAASGSEGG